MAACAISFAIYHLFDLPQGYWAVFTVVIVMQPSIGGTLGASRDRMIGTLAGAGVGAFAAAVRPQTPTGLAVALTLAVGLTGFGAALRTDWKVAPVTAAIMLLSPTGSSGPVEAALFRVLEITLGGVVAIGATLLILPARSHGLVTAQAGRALEQMAALAETLALQAVDPAGFEAAGGVRERIARHDRLRDAIGALVAAMADARREQVAHLGEHRLPEAVPRSLWRAHADISTIARILDGPAPVADRLGGETALVLEMEAGLMRACARAAESERRVKRAKAAADFTPFYDAMEALGRERLSGAVTFNDVGGVYALEFALESLQGNLSDLADRLDEAARGAPDRLPATRRR